MCGGGQGMGDGQGIPPIFQMLKAMGEERQQGPQARTGDMGQTPDLSRIAKPYQGEGNPFEGTTGGPGAGFQRALDNQMGAMARQMGSQGIRRGDPSMSGSFGEGRGQRPVESAPQGMYQPTNRSRGYGTDFGSSTSQPRPLKEWAPEGQQDKLREIERMYGGAQSQRPVESAYQRRTRNAERMAKNLRNEE